MSDDNRLGRRRVLQLSGGLLGTGLAARLFGDDVAAQSSTPGDSEGGDAEFVTNGVTDSGVGAAPTLEPLGRYVTGAPFDGAGSEIPAYDPASERVFTTNGNQNAVDVLDVSDPTDPTLAGQVDPSAAFDGAAGATNVTVHDSVLAASIPNEDAQADGAVGFYDAATLERLGVAEVGPLPDMVTFTPDGEHVLTANEGEPSSSYSEDPRGSVSVVDVSGGFDAATVRTAGFGDFVGQEDALREAGVRIYGPDANAAQDLEPEYVAVSPDSETAYVTLQENNAVGIVDVGSATVEDVVALGYKDFSAPGNALDAVDDGEIDLERQPLYGMYQPDAIEAFAADGETYCVIANEGDAREYDALFETGVLVEVDGEYGLDTTEDDGANVDVPVDASGFDETVLDALVGLEATTELGDVDGDGALEELYVFGGRSFSVLDSSGEVVYESGDDFERTVAEALPDHFNAGDSGNDLDSESPASGPEPEGVALGRVADTPYAFVGFEEVGGFAVYDLSTPADPTFVQYLNTRDFSVDPEAIEESAETDDPMPAAAADDLAPEGLLFVSADDSPLADPLLVVGYEVSGTTTVYRLGTDVLGIDSAAVTRGATGSVDLRLLAAMDGLAGATLTVSVDPDVARIAGADYADDLSLSREPRIAPDGSSVELSFVDVGGAVQPGATDVPLATLDVVGRGTGTADLQVSVDRFQAENGDDLEVATRNGLVVVGPPQVPGGAAPPTDPDGDRRYEDVNGNGRMDYDDVVTLFESFESDAVGMNVAAYDFNDNGKLDFDDVVELYEEV